MIRVHSLTHGGNGRLFSRLSILVAVFSVVSAATAATETGDGSGAGGAQRPVKFLFMSDHHVVSDAPAHETYTMWRPGNHAALMRTYEFIGEDPYCRDIDFALFAGDQLNTGYMDHPAERTAELANYYRTLESLDLHRRTKGTDLHDLDFRAPDAFYCRGNLPAEYVQKPIPFKPLASRVIAIQGNHDTAVADFYRECSFRCGDTRFITFFAEYVGLPADPGKFRSTGRISDETVAFVGREMAAAAADPSIRHIVLACHWSIVLGDPAFAWPIFDACPENGGNDNRRKILELAEKYGCDLYLNGHEHRSDWAIGRAGPLSDLNGGTVTARGGRGSFAIIEIHDDRAVVHVYSRAVAKEEPDGTVTFPELPHRLFTREIPLTPLHRDGM